MKARVRLLAGLAAGLVALTGCGFKGAYSLPLPGGAAHGKTYHVTAVFSDVQDLTVQAAVRVNDVAVGDVTSITLGTTDLQAHVGMDINQSVHLPRNAVATLEQTTLLGEKFVAISPPTTGAVGALTDGDVISNNGSGSTSNLPSVEEVFGLLSQVLNGGDLADLQTINIEVSKALAGRETAVRGALTQLNTFVTGLANQKQEIVRALDSLNRFSSALAQQNGTIATALTDLGPGLKVLADERAQFTALLTDLSTFGKVATHIIKASRTQTITGLRDLQPILHHLAAAGAALPRSLEILVTFPFPRDSSAASPGDYTNFQAGLNITPILCSAFANLGTAQVIALLLGPNRNTLEALLGSQLFNTIVSTGTCPSSVTGSNNVVAPPTGATGTGSGGGTSTPPPTGAGPSPTPTPSTTGLTQLLTGILGGGHG
jgi:phospholipid/cholesterol/gamma-HCH transport system substrate-binding protein